MNPTWIFLIDVALTAFVCLGIVSYVSRHLGSLLIELCGTAERASFWMVFSNVSLVVIPLIFALDYSPDDGRKGAIFEVAGQLRYALIGFITTLTSLALILLRFVPKEKSTPATHSAS